MTMKSFRVALSGRIVRVITGLMVGLFLTFGLAGVDGLGSQASAQPQQKSLNEIKQDFQRRNGGSMSSISVTKAPINGVVTCKGGGKRCKCDGFCVASETGCSCDSGIKSR